MRMILIKITVWIKFHIIYPIKVWWNFYIRHDYITDNIRNRALMEYCEKIMDDPLYQPQGAYENLFEDRLKETYEMVVKYLKEINEEEDVDWECVSYEKERPYCIIQIYEKLLQKPWVKE